MNASTAATFHKHEELFSILATVIQTVVSPRLPAINTEQVSFAEYSKLQPSVTSAQVGILLRCNTMNMFSFKLTDGSTAKAATCMFLESHFRFHEPFARLIMEPFAEKPIDNLASTSFCTKLVRGEWRRVWGCVTQINSNSNSIRHGRETAETVTVQKLQSHR